MGNNVMNIRLLFALRLTTQMIKEHKINVITKAVAVALCVCFAGSDF